VADFMQQVVAGLASGSIYASLALFHGELRDS
jgi:branched-subunit amino acid ABC-type transport system permease component